MLDLTFVGAQAVNGTTPYRVLMLADANDSWNAQAEYETKPASYPAYLGTTHDPRVLPFTLLKQGATPATINEWYQDALRVFNPGAIMTIKGVWRGITVERQMQVTRWTNVTGARVEGEFSAVGDPYWQTEAQATSSLSPLTVSAGNAPALPVITVTATQTCSYIRATITDIWGRGLQAYPVRLTINTVGIITNNLQVAAFHQGRIVPTHVFDPNTASTTIWAVVDVPPGGTAIIDLFYGTAIFNALAQELESGGLDFINSSNFYWQWSNFALFRTAPSRAGTWRPIKRGQILTSLIYELETASAGSSSMYVANATANSGLPSDMDGYQLTLGVPAGASGLPFINLIRNISNPSSEPVVMRVAYRVPDSPVWTQVEGVSATGIYSSSLGTVGAIEVMIWVSAQASMVSVVRYFWQYASTGFAISLDSGFVPSIAYTVVATARFLNSTLLMGDGQSLAFTNAYLTSGTTVTVDTRLKTISGLTYGSVTPSNRADWLALSLGMNNWTNPTNGTASFSWRDRYRI